jgi:hypothetical protein
MAAPVQPLVDDQSPWPGLSSYTENAQSFFFGRDSEIRETLSRIEALPFMLLFGQSGLGKTSLLQAGAMPRLRKKNYLPILLRLDYEAHAPEFDAQVTRALMAALAGIGAPPPVRAPLITEHESLWEWFHRSDTKLLDNSGQSLTPILIVDQFEEIFTLGQRDSDGRARSLRWLRSLAYLVENWCPAEVKIRMQENESLLEEIDLARRSLRVLISLREDYLPHLDERADELPSMMLNRLRLLPLGGAAALEAVHEPAPGLVTRQVAESIVRFVAGEPQAELKDLAIAPPILNLVCRELNERRMARGLSTIGSDLIEGDARKILRQFYEDSIADQPFAVRVFVEDELLSDSGHRENISEERAENVITRLGASKGALEELVKRRLLQKEERLGRVRLELIHDVLCIPIAQSRAERRDRERAAREEAEKRAALAKIRRLRLRAGLYFCCLCIALGLLLFAWWEYRQAQQSTAQAQQLAIRAQQSAAEAQQRAAQLSSAISAIDSNHDDLYNIGTAHPEIAPYEIELLKRDLSDIEKFLAQDERNTEILWIKFKDHLRLAAIIPSDKDRDGKLQHAKTSEDVADALLKISPDPVDKVRVAMGLSWAMKTYYALHENELGQKCYEKASGLLDQTVAKDSAEAHYKKSELIDSYYNARQANLSPQDKADLLGQACNEARDAYSAQQDKIEYVNCLAHALTARASFLYDNNPDSPEIDRDIEESFQLAKKVNDLANKDVAFSDLLFYRSSIAEVLYNHAIIQKDKHEWAKAEDSFKNYVSACKGLIIIDPDKSPVDYDYPSQIKSLAIAYKEKGDFERALAKAVPDQREAALNKADDDYQSGIKEASTLTNLYPKVAANWTTLGDAYLAWQNSVVDRAKAAAESQDPSAARQLYQTAEQPFENYISDAEESFRMAEPSEKDSNAQGLAIAQRSKGDFELARANVPTEDPNPAWQKALDAYKASLDSIRSVVERNPKSANFLLTKALAYNDLRDLSEEKAEAEQKSEHTDEAAKDYQSAISYADTYINLSKQVVDLAESVDRNERRSDLAFAWRMKAGLIRSRAMALKKNISEELAEAAVCGKSARDLAQELVNESPTHSAYWVALSRAHVVLKKISQASAKAAEDPIDIDRIKSCYQDVANESDESVAAARKALVVAAPADRDDCRDNLTDALGDASYDLLFSGRYAEAQQAAEEALKNDPQKVWIHANQAHALLLSGHYAEARAIYSRYGSKLAFSDQNQTLAEAVKNDFQEFEMLHFFFTAEQLVNIQKMRDELTSSGWRPSMDQAQKDTE